MEAIHLAKIENIEKGANAGRIERILGLDPDPLRIKVLL